MQASGEALYCADMPKEEGAVYGGAVLHLNGTSSVPHWHPFAPPPACSGTWVQGQCSLPCWADHGVAVIAGAFVLSTEAAADIQLVDASAALQLPGVVGYVGKKVGQCCCAALASFALRVQCSKSALSMASSQAACMWSSNVSLHCCAIPVSLLECILH